MTMTHQPEAPSMSLHQNSTLVGSSKLMLLFKGAISQNTLIRIGGLLHLAHEETHEDNSKKRLFSILVEMTQNILHYSQEREYFPYSGTVVGAGAVLVQEMATSYEVECSNLVTAEQKTSLEDQCSLINSMNQEQLRVYYLTQRRKKAASDSKGAGLGLIEIARKSKHPLIARFIPAPASFYYYSITARLNRDCTQN
jgi:hypothetical protein